MKKPVALTLLFFSIVMTGVAQSKNKKAPKPLTVFSVNQKQITAEEFIYLFKKNHQNKPDEFTQEKIQEYLDLFINFKLKVEEAQARGMDTTAAFTKEYNSYREDLRKPYLPDAKLTDSLVRLTYSRMKEEVRASHILINASENASPADTLKAYAKIMELKNKAKSAEEFAALAVAHSEDPSVKINKGDLGYFTAMQMVYPFETTAYTTQPGKVGGPIRTKFGYHIIYVSDRRPSSGEVEVSHIMIRAREEAEAQRAKTSIFNVYDLLRAGEKWESLCKQYSEDPGSKDNGGKIRPFGVGVMAAVPQFEQVAFSLQKPGDLSDPFQTQYGWHIMRLERKIPLAPLDELAGALKTKITRDERTQLSRHALYAKLRKEYQFEEKPEIKTAMLSLADSTLKKGKWNPSFPNAGKTVLFTLLGKGYYVSDFLTYTQKNQRRVSAASETKILEQLYQNYVDASVVQLAEERIITQNPEYRLLLREYYEGILLFEIMEKEVWNKATEDSTGMRVYFDQNKSNYRAGERARATVYSSTSKETIETLQKYVTNQDTLQIEDFVKNSPIKQENGIFEKSEKPIFQGINWTKGAYFIENNGMYYLAWLKNILPAGEQTFDEAKAAVISDYQNYLEKNWLTKLRTKHPVKIDEKGKKYVLAELQKK